MADFRHLVPNIMALAKALGSDYSHIHAVLSGRTSPSSKLAKRIEAETGGAVRAVWLLGLESTSQNGNSSSPQSSAA
jgi:hypothetical protein